MTEIGNIIMLWLGNEMPSRKARRVTSRTNISACRVRMVYPLYFLYIHKPFPLAGFVSTIFNHILKCSTSWNKQILLCCIIDLTMIMRTIDCCSKVKLFLQFAMSEKLKANDAQEEWMCLPVSNDIKDQLLLRLLHMSLQGKENIWVNYTKIQK